MIKLLSVITLIISSNLFAQTNQEIVIDDTVTERKFEDLKIFVKHVGFDSEKNSFNYTPNRQPIDIFIDSDFDRDDLCVYQQLTIIMKVLIANTHFIHRLNITEIQIDSLNANSATISAQKLKVEIYSDPVLRVEVGTKIDVKYASRTDYCKLVSSENLLLALNNFVKNR